MLESMTPERRLALAAPDLPPGLAWIWRAWERLADERPYSVEGIGMPMGGTLIRSRPGRIPWTAVERWAERQGYSDAELALLDACLRAMEAVFGTWWAEQNAR